MNNENIEKILNQLGAEELPADVQKIAEQTARDFEKTLTPSKQPKLIILRDYIMRAKLTKLTAAAAVIITAVVIITAGIFITSALITFQFGTSGVAWGAIAEKVGSFENVVFHITCDVKMQGMPPEQMPKTESIAYYSSEYGSRAEQYINGKLSFTMYLNPKENIYLAVMPEEKKYIKYADKTPEELRQVSDKDDPRVMVRHIMSAEYKPLGRDNINGIDVEGIECSGPRVMGGMFEDATARLWVERGTDYPVRIEIDGIVSGGKMEMSMVMDDFQWNVDIDPALFVPDIPDDYTSQEMSLPETNEGTAINGLRIFAELTGGKYPDNLALMTLMKEVSEAAAKKYGITLSDEQVRAEYTDTLKDILAAGAFYTRLAGSDKEAAYYGDKVTAENPELVLLRWKVSDGLYRVVFADLSAGNFSADELAELEKNLPQ